MMKVMMMVCVFLTPVFCIAQKQMPVSHGAVYGTKPNTVAMLQADKLETFMGKKTRISTTIKGTVTAVTKTKGGWFNVDAGNGKTIAAHFKVYNISIPMSLKGKTVIIEGVAEKLFMAADKQHFAGDNGSNKNEHPDKIDPKQKLTFEVTGLQVE